MPPLPTPMPRPGGPPQGPMPGGPGGPRSPTVGPGGPAGGPMVAPGGGAGNMAAATGIVNKAFNAMQSVLGAFPNGSKEKKALMSAMSTLLPLFSGEKASESGAAAGIQLAQAGSHANPSLAGTPNPGVNLAPMGPRMMNRAAGAPPGG